MVLGEEEDDNDASVVVAIAALPPITDFVIMVLGEDDNDDDAADMRRRCCCCCCCKMGGHDLIVVTGDRRGLGPRAGLNSSSCSPSTILDNNAASTILLRCFRLSDFCLANSCLRGMYRVGI
jgi:hypothetical protein